MKTSVADVTMADRDVDDERRTDGEDVDWHDVRATDDQDCSKLVNSNTCVEMDEDWAALVRT